MKVSLSKFQSWPFSGVRAAYRQLLLTAHLSFPDAKVEFSALFAELYPKLYADFIAQDHHHADSCTSMSVQLFTVPSVARHLISTPHMMLRSVIDVLALACETNIDSGKFF